MPCLLVDSRSICAFREDEGKTKIFMCMLVCPSGVGANIITAIDHKILTWQSIDYLIDDLIANLETPKKISFL